MGRTCREPFLEDGLLSRVKDDLPHLSVNLNTSVGCIFNNRITHTHGLLGLLTFLGQLISELVLVRLQVELPFLARAGPYRANAPLRQGPCMTSTCQLVSTTLSTGVVTSSSARM